MGVVYHTHYLIWCEIGRTDFIRERGATYAGLERDGLLLAVAEAQIRFHAPARYDDLIHVETWLERVQSRTVTFGYEIWKADAEPRERLATATTKLIALDRTGAPRTLPAELIRLFEHAPDQESS
ncbi:MAG: acyl-CoA thioesterase [Gemmatimonadetes bacterium]|nr:acyl-CoA thioesterase [Gemmatimonadota bacterium]